MQRKGWGLHLEVLGGLSVRSPVGWGKDKGDQELFRTVAEGLGHFHGGEVQ